MTTAGKVLKLDALLERLRSIECQCTADVQRRPLPLQLEIGRRSRDDACGRMCHGLNIADWAASSVTSPCGERDLRSHNFWIRRIPEGSPSVRRKAEVADAGAPAGRSPVD